jgi:hypothetical protein
MFAACFEPCLTIDWVSGRWKFSTRIVFTPISLRPGWLGNGDILPPLCLSRPCSSFTARCFLSLATLPRASRCPLSFASFTRVVVVSHADVCMPPLHCIPSASCSYCSLLTGPITLSLFMPSPASRFCYSVFFVLLPLSHRSSSSSSVNLTCRRGRYSFSARLAVFFLFLHIWYL